MRAGAAGEVCGDGPERASTRVDVEVGRKRDEHLLSQARRTSAGRRARPARRCRPPGCAGRPSVTSVVSIASTVIAGPTTMRNASSGRERGGPRLADARFQACLHGIQHHREDRRPAERRQERRDDAKGEVADQQEYAVEEDQHEAVAFGARSVHDSMSVPHPCGSDSSTEGRPDAAATLRRTRTPSPEPRVPSQNAVCSVLRMISSCSASDRSQK